MAILLDDSQKKRYEEYLDSKDKDNDQEIKNVELVLINKKY